MKTKILTASVKAAAIFIIGLFLASPASANPNVAVPLNDLGAGTYLGFEGGLFPGGSNEIPENHAEEGIDRGSLVTPRNTAGLPDPNGKIVLLSIGMSNTEQEYCGQEITDGVSCSDWTFVGQSIDDIAVDHDSLVFIDGAQGGQVAIKWVSPTNLAYAKIDQFNLAANGYSEAQVQVIWLKVANPNPAVSLPASNSDAFQLTSYLGSIVRALKVRYPNLQQVFVSSRMYAGYASTALNPEPFAYESGFSVKWLIEAQIDQMNGGGVDPLTGNLNYNSVAPWISWGPYLWADGLNPRSDGLVWNRVDFQSDGTHPSTAGETKAGALLLDFFKNSPQTQQWFLDNDPGPAYPVAVAAANIDVGPAPLSVDFDGSASTDSDGSIVAYVWDFGDGSTSSVANPSHVYINPGAYTASLTVTDDDGLTGTDTVLIQVDDPSNACTVNCLRSASVVLTYQSGTGFFRVSAQVKVLDENGSPVSGAAVKAILTFPDGTTQMIVRSTNRSGAAAFNVTGSSTGTYTLTINDITLANLSFDPANSVLSGSVLVP